ncbi:hypothetical protein [Philantomba monticola polyomavirus 1]|uniref:Uncharacterized protein n=1 Tax=Philantomba monticola polyomavirus 1 TaxID=2170411 RepID=A0A2S1CJI1_9POLY|nr:hypothetical protein [Philantomba monticola polyomavirus 1]AWD33734.1 hypothetical protein [Philantomba monticola polyomavirus 1]
MAPISIKKLKSTYIFCEDGRSPPAKLCLAGHAVRIMLREEFYFPYLFPLRRKFGSWPELFMSNQREVHCQGTGGCLPNVWATCQFSYVPYFF